jgi:hypothetical protein
MPLSELVTFEFQLIPFDLIDDVLLRPLIFGFGVPIYLLLFLYSLIKLMIII